MNCRFLGGPLDRTVCYIAPPPATIPADGGGLYEFDGAGIYRFRPELEAVPHPLVEHDAPQPGADPNADDADSADASEVVHVRPARRRTTTRRKRAT